MLSSNYWPPYTIREFNNQRNTYIVFNFKLKTQRNVATKRFWIFLSPTKFNKKFRSNTVSNQLLIFGKLEFSYSKSAAIRRSAADSRRRYTSDTAEPATARRCRASGEAGVAMETAGQESYYPLYSPAGKLGQRYSNSAICTVVLGQSAIGFSRISWKFPTVYSRINGSRYLLDYR